MKKEFYGVRYLSNLEYEDLGKVKRYCPFLLKHPFFGKVQQDLGKQYLDKIERGFVAPVVIQHIDDTIGYGLFADQSFEVGDYIGEYTGIVREIKWYKRDMNAYCLSYPTRLLSWKSFVIDASTAGNEMRFVNHSDRPNLRLACLVLDGLLHFVLFALRDIEKGEQLTLNYGKDFWIRRKKLTV